MYQLRGQFAQTMHYVQRLQAIIDRLGNLGWLDVNIYFYLINNAFAQGDYVAVERIYADGKLHLGQHDTYQRIEGPFLYLHARSLWLQGRLHDAKRVYQAIQALPASLQNAILRPGRAGGRRPDRLGEGRLIEAETLLRQATVLAGTHAYVV